MSDKRDLPDRIIGRMQEIRDEIADPWDEKGALRAQARAAQEETAGLVTSIAQSLSEICIRSGHRGAVKGGPNSPSRPCMKCQTKVKHYREVANIIGPY